MNISNKTQILVIGGGPAGATAATLLAKEGFQVTLCERDHFPRYHIGESLLPSVLPILRLIGANDQVEAAGFPRKEGGSFNWGGEQWLVDWSDKGYSYQVDRATFDHILLENAGQKGVNIYQGIKITKLSFHQDRPVRATWSAAEGNAGGEIAFDYLVDASGRQGLMSTRYLKSRQYMESFRHVAIWGYWKNATPPNIGISNPILIDSIADGWFWAIPQRDKFLSVGLVMHKDALREQRTISTLEEIYKKNIEQSELLQKTLISAQLETELRTESDYSYFSPTLAGPGFFLVGDAACFLDPLLSSGVHLAMYSALIAAASLGSIIRKEVSETSATSFYQKCYRGNFLRWTTLVSSLYGTNRAKESFFWTAQKLSAQDLGLFGYEEMKQTFTDMVSGMVDLEDATESGRLVKNQDRIQDYFQQNQNKYITELREMAKPDSGDRHRTSFINAKDTLGLMIENAVDGMYLAFSPHLGLKQLRHP